MSVHQPKASSSETFLSWRHRVGLVVVAMTILLLGFVGAGRADASAGGSLCLPVRLTGVGVATSATTTTAKIFLKGREIASTTGTFSTPDASSAFTGSVVFTPKRIKGGTLVADVAGSFGPNFASFSATGPVSGTGFLSRASGHLSFAGPLNPDGSFTEVITGTLCADLNSW